MNEYINMIEVYIGVIDRLMNISNMYYYTQENTKVNFKIPAFKTLVEQKGGGENYRFYMKNFRQLGFIVCTNEKFSNVQKIKGKPERVITVDYLKYLKLKDMIGAETYFSFLDRFILVVDKVLQMNKHSEKQICVFSKNEELLNVKSSDFRKLLKNECGSMELYEESLEVFRAFDWIICNLERFTNIQNINGQSSRVFSIAFKKYKLMKELLETEI
ncbi:MAG: hypothetical protein ACI4LO_07790 [Anaerovoracaceae bacterium]